MSELWESLHEIKKHQAFPANPHSHATQLWSIISICNKSSDNKWIAPEWCAETQTCNLPSRQKKLIIITLSTCPTLQTASNCKQPECVHFWPSWCWSGYFLPAHQQRQTCVVTWTRSASKTRGKLSHQSDSTDEAYYMAKWHSSSDQISNTKPKCPNSTILFHLKLWYIKIMISKSKINKI